LKNLNIALLHYTCPPVVGGVEEVVRQQASLFHRYYHKVKIFAGAGDQFTKDYQIEINPLLSSRNKQILRAHELILENNLNKMETLSQRIHQYLCNVLDRFDLLIAHNVLTMPFNLPLTYALHRMAQDSSIPIVSWNHDSPYFYHDYPRYLDQAPWNILKRINSKIHYVVISESRKAQFSELYGTKDRLYVVPNGIDPIRFFRLDPNTVRLIQEQKLFESDFLMVQPSRLHPRKNIELSIRVTRALRDRNINARLLLTGAYDPHEHNTVEYYNKLQDLARKLNVEKDIIVIAEYRYKSGERITPDRILIRDLYLIADILFLPSWQEGFGIPLLESGMIKLPVVCSNIPPFVEVGGEDVCMFNLDSPPEVIAHKILEFLHALKPQRMFRRVIRDYVWDNIYHSKLLPILQSIVEENHETEGAYTPKRRR